MDETIQTNLAATPLRTSAPESGSTARNGATHVIDRVASWVSAASAVAVVVLLLAGWGSLARIAESEGVWLLAGLAVSLAVLSGALTFRLLISPMVGNQLREMAEVAEAVAAGDLTRTPDAARQGGELGRIGRGLVTMTHQLRELSAALAGTSAETVRLAQEITHSTEEMAQAAGGIADTAATLSRQAQGMAGTIGHLTAEAARLRASAAAVTSGAQEGMSRNERLRSLASENHDRLDESAGRIEELAADVRASAVATESLAQATDQVRAFVALVQKIARQSKLLALNAAMEAARAGEQGEGFAVVATEVRRLAATAATAAEQTGALMQQVLVNIEAARATSARALSGLETVHAATAIGQRSFTQVEAAVAAGDQWTAAIGDSASAASLLASEITRELDSLAAGTQAFASAMHDVAAASEEQSASTEQIAAAAAHLTQAVDGVAKASRALRTK